MGFHEQHYGPLAIFGKTYLVVLYNMSKKNDFDLHLLPDNLLVDGATNDLGSVYAARLLRTRKYLRQRHPLVRHLATLADMTGVVVDLNPYLRMEAGAFCEVPWSWPL